MPESAAMSTEERVWKIIEKYFGDDAKGVGEEKRMAQGLVEDLYADELDREETRQWIEDEFGVDFTDEEADAWQTVGDIVGDLKKRGVEK